MDRFFYNILHIYYLFNKKEIFWRKVKNTIKEKYDFEKSRKFEFLKAKISSSRVLTFIFFVVKCRGVQTGIESAPWLCIFRWTQLLQGTRTKLKEKLLHFTIKLIENKSCQGKSKAPRFYIILILWF